MGAKGVAVLVDYIPDEGCEYHPTCLTCPFPVCKHDDDFYDVVLIIDEVRDTRDELIRKRRRDGVMFVDLAKEFGVSERTVYRVVKE